MRFLSQTPSANRAFSGFWRPGRSTADAGANTALNDLPGGDLQRACNALDHIRTTASREIRCAARARGTAHAVGAQPERSAGTAAEEHALPSVPRPWPRCVSATASREDPAAPPKAAADVGAACASPPIRTCAPVRAISPLAAARPGATASCETPPHRSCPRGRRTAMGRQIAR